MISKATVVVQLLLIRLAYGFLVVKPQDTEVLLGQSTYLNCSTSIITEDIYWYHYAVGATALDKREVYAFGRIYEPYLGRFNIDKTFNGSFNLLINSVHEEDAGRYDCQDDGGFGDISSAQLIVLVADPVCRSKTTMDEVVGPNSCQIESDKPELSCIAQYRGNIPPIMEWISLKENLSQIQPNVTKETNDNNVTYRLMPNVDLSINGSTYICQTTRTTSAQLNCSLGPIKILYALDTKFAKYSSINEELICSANSSQSCSYRWRWFQNDEVTTESKNASLKPIKLGWHKCEADCSINKQRCSILAMHVFVCLNSDYDLLLIKPKDTEVLLGQSTYLNCSTSIIKEDMHWYHYAVGASALEKREVYAFGKIYEPYLGRFNIDEPFKGTFNLLINSVQEEDAGRYECQDDGGFGDIFSAQLVVLVADPVCRSTTTVDEVVGPNSCQLEPDKPELSCIVQYRGNIPPGMEWRSLKENVSYIQRKVTQETNDNNVTYRLMLNVDLSVNGSTYICQTSRSTSPQHGCFLDPIKILYAFDTNFTANASTNEELICSANSSQSCTYRWKWFQDDDVSTESRNASLKPTKPGWHKCEADCFIKKQPCSILAMYALVYQAPSEQPLLSNSDSDKVRTILLAVLLPLSILSVFVVIGFYFCMRKRNKRAAMIRYNSIAYPEPAVYLRDNFELETTTSLLHTVRIDARVQGDAIAVDQAEKEIISGITNLLANRSLPDSNRILELVQQNLVAVRKGNSVDLYFACHQLSDVDRFQQMTEDGRLKETIETVFNRLIKTSPKLRVQLNRITPDFKEYRQNFKGVFRKLHYH